MNDLGLFADVSRVQLQRVADRHTLGTLVSVEPLGGSSGNNLSLGTATGRWVLRAAPPPHDAGGLRRERFFARNIEERTSIDAPWPYLVDESTDLLGWPYALLPLLPGEVLFPGLDLPWDRIGTAFGAAVAELHRITFADIGEWDPELDDIAPAGVAAPDWFRRRAGDLADKALLDDASSTFFKEVVEEAAGAITEFAATYVHGDLAIGNLTAQQHPQGFRFTGVFDLGGGYAGDPDEDLATPLWWPLYWNNPTLSRTFYDSYRAEHPARPGCSARLRGYLAVSLLANWETGHRLGHDWYGGTPTFQVWALPLLDRACEIVAG